MTVLGFSKQQFQEWLARVAKNPATEQPMEIAPEASPRGQRPEGPGWRKVGSQWVRLPGTTEAQRRFAASQAAAQFHDNSE